MKVIYRSMIALLSSAALLSLAMMISVAFSAHSLGTAEAAAEADSQRGLFLLQSGLDLRSAKVQPAAHRFLAKDARRDSHFLENVQDVAEKQLATLKSMATAP